MLVVDVVDVEVVGGEGEEEGRLTQEPQLGDGRGPRPASRRGLEDPLRVVAVALRGRSVTIAAQVAAMQAAGAAAVDAGGDVLAALQSGWKK